MKLTSILLISSFVVSSAFGVTPARSTTKTNPSSVPSSVVKPAFRSSSLNSPLFRDPSKVRGGAVPGWAAYNEALDKKPLITKAMTSLVGWALGDLLAQVRSDTSRRGSSLSLFFDWRCRSPFVWSVFYPPFDMHRQSLVVTRYTWSTTDWVFSFFMFLPNGRLTIRLLALLDLH